jgi:hypothetical protein
MKATLFSFVSLLVSLCFFALLFRPGDRSRQTNVPSPTPIDSPQVQVETKPEDPNEKFRIIPANFKDVDFENRDYGSYGNSSEDPISLNLVDGDYEYSEGDVGESFNLVDVYFSDVTGDESPEAILVLWHVQCGVSCDGGSALFLVYRIDSGSLKEIWRFETGSYEYGCGLKSLTVMKKQITVQMFGKCSKPRLGYSGPGKFLVGNTTLSNFRFSRGRFVKSETEFFYAPIKDVKNFDAPIHIID